MAAVCFILPTGQHLTCRGECPGRVAFERLAGDYGFGYDPLFIPDECGVGKTDKRPNSEGRSYAQLTPDEKDAISHRGNALAEMEKELPEFLRKRSKVLFCAPKENQKWFSRLCAGQSAFTLSGIVLF